MSKTLYHISTTKYDEQSYRILLQHIITQLHETHYIMSQHDTITLHGHRIITCHNVTTLVNIMILKKTKVKYNIIKLKLTHWS